MTTAPRRHPLSGVLFLGATAVLTLAAVATLYRLVDLERSHPVMVAFVLICFGLLFFNVVYMVVCTVVAKLAPRRPLPRAALVEMPATATVYIVKNEPDLRRFLEPTAGAVLGQPWAHLWLLSNSDRPEAVASERALVEHLRAVHGEDVVHYRPPALVDNPLGRKHVCFSQWLRGPGAAYRYSLVCDADSTVTPGTLADLVRMAEHPDNDRYAAFQGRLEIGSRRTPFVRQFLLSNSLWQKIYLNASFWAFDTAPLFGHGMLVRNQVFARLEVPARVLSHDIHDAASLAQAGHRVAFCPEVVTYEEYPANYIESLRRDARWVEGTLQSLPLMFRRDLTLGARFYVFYPIYNYLLQVALLCWILGSFFADTEIMGRQLTHHHVALIGAGSSSVELAPTILPALLWVVIHRFAFVRTLSDAVQLLRETAFSTLLMLNNVLYTTWAVVSTPFRSRRWRPMNKAAGEVGLWEAARYLWPSLALGLLTAGAGLQYAQRWLLLASPFILAFLLAIPMTVYSSRRFNTDEAGAEGDGSKDGVAC